MHPAPAKQFVHFLAPSSINAPQPAQCPFLHVLQMCIGCAWSRLAEQTQQGENGGTLIGSERSVSLATGLLVPGAIVMPSLGKVATGSRDSERLGSRVRCLVVARPSAP